MHERIAVFLPSLAGGGAEKSMLVLAHALARRGFAVDLVLAQAKGPYLAEVGDKLRLIDLKASRVLFSLPALIRYLRQERPAALLSSLDYANVVALWARRLAGIPDKVVVNDQNTLSIVSKQSSQLRQRLVPLLVKHFYPWSDRIVGNSRGVAEDLQQITGLPEKQIQIIYNPVVTPDMREKTRVFPDHPWLQNSDVPVLLAIGRLTAQKDFATLLRAVAQVQRMQPCRLIILGEGPDRAELEALVGELRLGSSVSLPGFVKNPYAYLARASLFVLSSRWEGLPTVLIEALACGVPVIATDCPSGPREILADGRYGTLVPMQDATALAEAIRQGLNGHIARPPAESWQPYELQTIVDQYSKILAEARHA